jgi:carbon-monoxide dehydrogenase large subunit
VADNRHFGEISNLQNAGRFTRGGGRYVADLAEDDTLSVGFIRSTVARGWLRSVDLKDVLAHEGIIAAFSAQDIKDYISPLEVRFGPGKSYEWHLLAQDWVSFVGEPIAMVVGVNRATVEEACEMVDVDYEPLDAVVNINSALTSSNLVRPEIGSNVAFLTASEVGNVDEALEHATVVIDRHFHLGRQSACPLENRGVLAYADALTKELIVYTSTQIPHIVQEAVAKVLGRSVSTVRVIVPDVGGGFGLKCQVSAEECLVAWMAQYLGRRVAWLEDRWENLVASNQAHDEWLRVRTGFSDTGEIVGIDAEVTVDVGAQSSYPLSVALEPSSTSGHLFGCYRVKAARLRSQGIVTNKAPSGAYRGVGAPIASFATERVLDEAAKVLELSRLEIRRRNLLTREDMPYQHAIAGLIDSGDPRGVFDHLVSAVRRDLGSSWELSLLESPDKPENPVPEAEKFVGVGIAVFTEHTGPGSAVYRKRGANEVPGYDAARITLEENGTFSVYISSASAGQNHVGICQQEVANILQVDPRFVSVVEGDTARCPKGTGTFASRFTVAQMSAVSTAAKRMMARLREVAASYLGCSADEVIASEKGFRQKEQSTTVSIPELAKWLYFPTGPRQGISLELPVEESGYWDGGPAFPCGAMLSLVEIDGQSLISHVRKIVAVEECGRVFDRKAVQDQLRGGIVMGIGDALLGEHVYSEDGDVMTSSFMDYLLPTVAEIPEVKVEIYEDEKLLTLRSETGSKGIGEAGTIGAVASVGCAVSEALRSTGICVDELPATPLKLYQISAQRNISASMNDPMVVRS